MIVEMGPLLLLLPIQAIRVVLYHLTLEICPEPPILWEDLGVIKNMIDYKDGQNKTILILGGLIVVCLMLYFIVSALMPKVGQKTNLNNQNDIEINPNFKKVTPKEEEVLKKLEESAEKLAIIDDKTYAKYPWKDKLPLMTDKYFVYFNLEEEKFYIKIYDKSAEEVSMSEITRLLQEKGIDVNKYTFVKK